MFKMFISLLFVLTAFAVQGSAQKTAFDKSAFFTVMASGNLQEINAQLNIINATSFNEKEAYEGALQMKKAGLLTKAKEKLKLFRSGRIKLEAAIKKDIGNTEFYFLRLIIQEHAPKAVNYHNDLENDSLLIRSTYKMLSAVVQKSIHEYSKKSKILKPL